MIKMFGVHIYFASAALMSSAILALLPFQAEAQGQGQGRQPVQARPAPPTTGGVEDPFTNRTMMPTTSDDSGNTGTTPFDESGKCEADEKGVEGWLSLLPELKAIRNGYRTAIASWDLNTGPDSKYFAHSKSRPGEANVNKAQAKQDLMSRSADFNKLVVDNYQNAIINCQWCKTYNNWGRLLVAANFSGTDALRWTGDLTHAVPPIISVRDLTPSQVNNANVDVQATDYVTVHDSIRSIRAFLRVNNRNKCNHYFNQFRRVHGDHCSLPDAENILDTIRNNLMGSLQSSRAPGEKTLLREWIDAGWPSQHQDYCKPAATFLYFQDILNQSRNWPQK